MFSSVAFADTLGAMPDTTGLAGALGGFLGPILALLPAGMQPVVFGFLVALAVDALQFLFEKLNIPLTKLMSGPWGRIVNPLLVLAIGWLSTGNALMGVIAAGLRSMVFKGSIIETSSAGLKRLSGAAAIIATLFLLAAPAPASAEGSVSLLARERFHPNLGLGQRWDFTEMAEVNDVAPGTFVRLGLIYGITNHAVLDIALDRFPWQTGGDYWAVTVLGKITL